MKRLLFALLLMCSFPMFAVANCDIKGTGLSDEAVSKLRLACEQAKLDEVTAKNATPTVEEPLLTAEKASAYGQVANDIAKAIGTAAGELGIAVNKFVTSPAGILVVIGIFWKLFLTQTIGIIGTIFTIFATMWLVRRCMIGGYEPKERVWFWGAFTTIRQVPRYIPIADLNETQGGTMLLSIIGGVALVALFVFKFIT